MPKRLYHYARPPGYVQVSVPRGHGHSGVANVHRLVAEAFLGPIPRGMQVNHIDGDKANNVPANLEIVTPKENQRHAVRCGLIRAGEKCRSAKLTKEQAQLAVRLYLSRTPVVDIASALRVSDSTVRRILNGQCWKDLGGPFPKLDLLARGSRTSTAKLNESQIRTLRSMRKAGATAAELARLFGVCESTVYRAISGKYWRHVTAVLP